MGTIRRVAAATAVVTTMTLGSACSRSAAALPDRYCNAVKTITFYDTGLRGENDVELVKAAYARTTRDLDQPLARVAAEGPSQAAKAAGTLRAGYARSAQNGVDSLEELLGPSSTLIDASRRGCRWHRQSISARDYGYIDAPHRLARGTTAVSFTNTSSREPHLFLVARIKPTVVTPLHDLIAQYRGPETPADADIEYVDGGAFAAPHQTTTGLVDLRPGRYLYFCPIPVTGGTGETDDHASHGMIGEFRVR